MKKEKSKIIGRAVEIDRITQALRLERNLLIEGPVGVGKTFLVAEVLSQLGKTGDRVDGDTRYTEQKLTGWFDPPLVLEKGYTKETFVPGPLVTSMEKGRVLFINELNRMPEAVQNILLPAMDEKCIQVPKLGEVRARSGFSVVATQNPREFTATHTLSEALMDRFDMIHLDYQSEEEEKLILSQVVKKDISPDIQKKALRLIRATRNHPSIKRGASIRAAIALCELVSGGLDFRSAAFMALSSRVEVINADQDLNSLIEELLAPSGSPSTEKKTLNS